MSRERYHARSKKVQKLGHDGLVERDLVTGEERRVSQRTADISFGPERDTGQRVPRNDRTTRRRQRPPTEQAVVASDLEQGGTPVGPVAEAPAPRHDTGDKPTSRLPPDSGGSNTARRYKASSIRQQLDHSQRLVMEQDTVSQQIGQEHELSADTAESEETTYEPESIATGRDTTGLNHPPGVIVRPSLRHAEDGGRLQFEQGQRNRPPVPDTQTEAKRQRTTKHGSQAIRPEEHRPRAEDTPRKGADVPPADRQQELDGVADGGRLQFESRQAERPPALDTRPAEKRQRTKHTPEAVRPAQHRLRFEDMPPKGPRPHSGTPKAEQRSEQKTEIAQGQLRCDTYDGKSVQSRHRLRFEDEAPENAAPSGPKRVGGTMKRTVASAATMAVHQKIEETEDDNVAVEATHRTELTAERGGGPLLRWNRTHRQAKTDHIGRRGSPRFSSNPISRWQQKRAIKRRYAAAKRAETPAAGIAHQTATGGSVVEVAKRHTADLVRRHKRGFLLIGLIFLMIAMFSSVMASCSTLLHGGMSALTVSTYPSEDADMLAAEGWYSAKEAELQSYLDTYESTHSYDEYSYDLDDIEHDPYVLISTLTALRGGAWKIEDVADTLQTLFDRQYTLTETVDRETRHDSDGEPYTYQICTVTLKNFNLSHVPVYIMDQEQLSMYATYMGTLGNRADLFPDSDYINKYLVQGYTDHEIPAWALEDETFAAMMEEAEKYLGYPYVWGGSNPNTSFDCSGFVSWVLNHSGWNVGRLGAQGLYNTCAPVSYPRPGDLVFFTGTFAADTPVTHVGIYVGDGWMIHAGDPISYANITSNYYQSHFYAYGRLP